MKPTLKIIRLPEVHAQTGMSRSAIYLKIKQGIWPPPIPLGERSMGFIQNEVDRALGAMINGATPDELKELILIMVEQRNSLVGGLS